MILCCGEALIDMMPCRHDGMDAFAPRAGGAVFNTAIALGRLGAPAGFLSGISRDFFGDILRESLSASGVDTEHVVFSDRPTTLAFVKLDDGQARYLFYDENTAGRMLSAAALPSLGADVDALFFGGISLISEPCGSAYEALLAREAKDRLIMLDPNIRADFVSDETAYRGRIDRMIDRADIVKLSDEDLHWLAGAGDTDTLARRIIARGPKLVFVTRGADGAVGYTARRRAQVEASRVEIADTVGAGDTFNAGILFALAERGLLSKSALAGIGDTDIASALDVAVQAAAVTVSRIGADPPWRHELDLEPAQGRSAG